MILIPPVVVDLEPAPQHLRSLTLPFQIKHQHHLRLEADQAQPQRQRTASAAEPEVRGGASASRLDATWAAADSGPSSGGTTNANTNLDGLPLARSRGSSSSAFGPQGPRIEDNTVNPYRRAPLGDNGVNPYLTENEFFKGELEIPLPAPQLRDRESARQRDHSEVISSKGVLRRRHVKWRLRTLSPWRHLRFQWS